MLFFMDIPCFCPLAHLDAPPCTWSHASSKSAKPAPHRPRSSPWQARPKQQEQLGDATYRFGRHKTKIEPAKSKKKQKYGQSAKCDHKGISSKKCMDPSVPRLNSAFHLQLPVSRSLSVSDVQWRFQYGPSKTDHTALRAVPQFRKHSHAQRLSRKGH